MIDPISAFALIKTAHSALMSGIKMGKDFSKMGNVIANFAQGEATLNVVKQKKKNSIFGNVVGNAIEEHFQEEERERMYNELRSITRLYGSEGQWERLAGTIASAKAEHQKQLKAQAKIDERNKMITVISITLLLGLAGVFYFAMYLKGDF